MRNPPGWNNLSKPLLLTGEAAFSVVLQMKDIGPLTAYQVPGAVLSTPHRPCSGGSAAAALGRAHGEAEEGAVQSCARLPAGGAGGKAGARAVFSRS